MVEFGSLPGTCDDRPPFHSLTPCSENDVNVAYEEPVACFNSLTDLEFVCPSTQHSVHGHDVSTCRT